MTRHVPVPVRQTKIHVVNEFSKYSFVKVQVCTVKGEELPVEVNVHRSRCFRTEPAMDVCLPLKASRVSRITRVQRPHCLVCIFDFRNFTAAQGRSRTSREYRAAVTTPRLRS